MPSIPLLLLSRLKRLALALTSLLFFILALYLIKSGAAPMAPWIRSTFSVDGPLSALGLGWLGSMLALSGSPIAAAALSLQNAGVLSSGESFAMIAGTRLGASFVVLLVGLAYLWRGKPRQLSMGVGLLALLVTQTMYLLVLPIGAGLLGFYLRNGKAIGLSAVYGLSSDSTIDRLFEPVTKTIAGVLPEGLLLLGGILLVIASLRLFDLAIPEFHLEHTQLGLVHRLLYRPWVSFLLGMAVTTLTLSVSVSLGLLVPLSVRGYVRRENVIPYIMGANITTFDDTLVAAFLLGNPGGIAAVLAQMTATLCAALLILLFFRQYERMVEKLFEQAGKSNTRLLAYIALLFIIPFFLIWIG